jgi:hypothetical protein
MKHLTSIVVTALACAVTAQAGNLIQNGDFSLGNTDFSSDYSYIPYDYGSYTSTPTVADGDYTVGPFVPPSYFDWAAFHTVSGGSSQMLIANGAASASDSVWSQNVSVSPGKTYTISFYLAEISTPVSVADLAVNLGGTQIGSATAPSVIDTWQQYNFTWNSGSSTSVLLALNDLNTLGTYNDFAIDNISMSAPVSGVPDQPSNLILLALCLPFVFAPRRKACPQLLPARSNGPGS